MGILPVIPKELTKQVLEKGNYLLPKVRLRVRDVYSIDLLERMENDELDLTVLYGPTTKYTFDCSKILSEEIFLKLPSVQKELIQVTFI